MTRGDGAVGTGMAVGDAAGREAEWISRVVVQDDHDAFAALVRLHQEPVRRFLRRLCGDDWQKADDLVQETFWKAYRHIGGYRGRGRFLGWLFGIAWQLHAGERRGAAARGFESLDDETVEPPDAAPDLVDQHALEQLLQRLRPEERAAMILYYAHGMSHPEVASVLGIPLGTVKSLILRGRSRLQRLAGSSEPAGRTGDAP